MGKRILVIDDDVDILAILEIILGDEGYDVVLQNTGISTEYIKIIHPDLILLDFRITGFHKTGGEICKEIKLELLSENIPVLICSAEVDVDVLAESCGANGFITKPFEIVDLLQKVREFVA